VIRMHHALQHHMHCRAWASCRPCPLPMYHPLRNQVIGSVQRQRGLSLAHTACSRTTHAPRRTASHALPGLSGLPPTGPPPEAVGTKGAHPQRVLGLAHTHARATARPEAQLRPAWSKLVPVATPLQPWPRPCLAPATARSRMHRRLSCKCAPRWRQFEHGGCHLTAAMTQAALITACKAQTCSIPG
jgi:hypothetical protein